MISKAAVAAAEFGDGVEGRLTMKAFMGFEELCKSNRRHELPKEVTAQMARMVEEECRGRARDLKTASKDEARQAVITCCMKAMEKFPLYEETLRRMILHASANFSDLTASLGGGPRTGRPGLLLEKEERLSRSLQKEESKEMHPPDPAAEA